MIYEYFQSAQRNKLEEEKGEFFGKAFEHFILMEIMAYNSYHELDFEINFWRTKSGLEVDFILGGGEVAIEVKGTTHVENKDLYPLKVFIKENSTARACVVCNEKLERIHEQIRVIPYRRFLKDLWEGKIIR